MVIGLGLTSSAKTQLQLLHVIQGWVCLSVLSGSLFYSVYPVSRISLLVLTPVPLLFIATYIFHYNRYSQFNVTSVPRIARGLEREDVLWEILLISCLHLSLFTFPHTHSWCPSHGIIRNRYICMANRLHHRSC